MIFSDIVGIIADDLTGANDTALQFKLNGADTNILLNDNIDNIQEHIPQAWSSSPWQPKVPRSRFQSEQPYGCRNSVPSGDG